MFLKSVVYFRWREESHSIAFLPCVCSLLVTSVNTSETWGWPRPHRCPVRGFRQLPSNYRNLRERSKGTVLFHTYFLWMCVHVCIHMYVYNSATPQTLVSTFIVFFHMYVFYVVVLRVHITYCLTLLHKCFPGCFSIAIIFYCHTVLLCNKNALPVSI